MMILLDVQLRVLVQREEMNQQHLFQPCISDSFPPSSIRSNPASFYATELLMGFPWFDNRLRGARSLTDTLPQFDCSAVSQNIDRVQFRNTAENELQSVGQSMQMMGEKVSPGKSNTNKTRIQWAQDLHEKFVEAVNRLGGAEKATPKGILNIAVPWKLQRL
ncbi:protein PHOSPHATE STARVATION RESPONSE 2-like isoform X2 [Dioscorea cayenensis subsp. rotundata]|uniref:Protein PHOSPHATE STARVATION RESPONSE 2-like isoform X2 n=1 Tax=Dioscorea cayennensis subsp. rotundata TaxID=55577 RepID=A0AB40AUK2_DIOCR|nr:protein PHOSPHATE STARVATION RESPONSE 2-like isoform X2 [Dioscorea cayenensis subsp. rotundata]